MEGNMNFDPVKVCPLGMDGLMGGSAEPGGSDPIPWFLRFLSLDLALKSPLDYAY
jgi:hypothetical protein